MRGNILSNRKTSVYIQQVKRVAARNLFNQGLSNIWILNYIDMNVILVGWCPSHNFNRTRDDDDGVSTQTKTFRATNWPENPHQRDSFKSQSCTPVDFDGFNSQVTFRALKNFRSSKWRNIVFFCCSQRWGAEKIVNCSRARDRSGDHVPRWADKRPRWGKAVVTSPSLYSFLTHR